MSGITLTVTQQETLAALHDSSALAAQTAERLNTGEKVNGVADDAVAYFRSRSLTNRANALNTVKANIGQSVQSVQAALDATSAVEGLLEQLKGVLESARGATLSQRVSATVQFKSIGRQLGQLVRDASYQGLNLLTSSSASLTTQFSERTAATLTIPGYDLTATGAATSRSLFTQASVFDAGGNLFFSALVNESEGGGFSDRLFYSTLIATGTFDPIGPVGYPYLINIPPENSVLSTIPTLPPISTAGNDYEYAYYGVYGYASSASFPLQSNIYQPPIYSNVNTFRITSSTYGFIVGSDVYFPVTYGIGGLYNGNSQAGGASFSAYSKLYNFEAYFQTTPINNNAVGGFSALNILGGILTGGDANTTLPASIIAAIYTQTDNRLDAAISQIQAISGSLGINVDILQPRTNFTANYATTLQGGSDKLTLADLNEEAANSQALALRQQIGIQSLSISGQQNASILSLLR